MKYLLGVKSLVFGKYIIINDTVTAVALKIKNIEE